MQSYRAGYGKKLCGGIGWWLSRSGGSVGWLRGGGGGWWSVGWGLDRGRGSSREGGGKRKKKLC